MLPPKLPRVLEDHLGLPPLLKKAPWPKKVKEIVRLFPPCSLVIVASSASFGCGCADK